MTDRRLASIELGGQLSDRQPLLDEWLELLPRQPASRRMLLGTDRPQPVRPEISRHGRFVHTEPPAHRRKRQSLGQHAFEQGTIHTAILEPFPLQTKGFGAVFTPVRRKFSAV